MNWYSDINYFLFLLAAYVVTIISGQEDIAYLYKPYLPGRNVVFDKSVCSYSETAQEFDFLRDAINFDAKYKDLVIIISHNVTDAVDLARFLTNYNQTLITQPCITRKQDQLHYSQNLIKNPCSSKTQQHLLQYFDGSTETAYLVHRGEFVNDNDSLVDRFFTKKVIDNARRVKIILTCKQMGDVERLFEFTHKILNHTLRYKKHILLVATPGEGSYGKQEAFVNVLKDMSTATSRTGKLVKFILEEHAYLNVSSFDNDTLKEMKKMVKDIKFKHINKTDFIYSATVNSTQEYRATCTLYQYPGALIHSSSLVHKELEAYLNSIKDKYNKNSVDEVRQYANTMVKIYTYLSSNYNYMLKSLKTSHLFFDQMREIVHHLNFSLSEKTSHEFYTIHETLYNYLFDVAMPVQLETRLYIHSLSNTLRDNLEFYKFYEGFLEIADVNLFKTVIDNKKEQRFRDMSIQIENSSLVSNESTFESGAFETLKRTFYNRNVTTKCSMLHKEKAYKLEVRGDVVSMSHVKNNICENVTYIEIFALNTVVIDDDLNLRDKKVEVGIVAPIWLIFGNRTIDLSGANGKKWEIGSTAKSGTTDGTKVGAHGKPGDPGGSAGHFYGVAEKIVNGQNLFVIASGGKGGSGQRGGNGARGDDGETAQNETIRKENILKGSKWRYTMSIRTDLKNSYAPSNARVYEIFGISGQGGGRGGNGGIGGFGGIKGDIKILELGKKSHHSVNIFNVPGSAGTMGICGVGGAGGINGADLIVSYSTYYYSNAPILLSPDITELEKNISKGYAPHGANGTTGGHFIGSIPAERVHKIQSFPRIVNNYKNYARENFHSVAKNNKLQNFYSLLNNHAEVLNTYTVLDIMEEFLDLERQLDSLVNTSMLYPSYENLLRRVADFEIKIKNENKSNDYNFSPISPLVDDLKQRVMDNQKLGYHEPQFSMRNEYDNLKSKYINQLKKANVAEKFTDIFQNFTENIDARIEEGREILKTVQTVITNVESELDRDLDSLVNEVIEARKRQNKQIGELTEEIKRIEDRIQRKMLIGIPKTVCQLLGLIHPALGAAGIAATSVLNVVENSMDVKANESLRNALAISIPKAVSMDITAAEDFLMIKKQAMEDLINKRNEIIDSALAHLPKQEDGQVLKRWKSEGDLGDLRVESKNTQPLSLSYRTIESKFETEKQELLKENEKGTHRYEKSLETIEKLKTVTQTADIFGGVLDSISKDEVLKNNVTNAIQAANRKFLSLRVFEEDIYRNLTPVLDSIKGKLYIQREKLNNASKINLLFTKWKITSEFNTMKEYMKSMLKEYKANEEFTWSMKKLIDAVEILIEIHNQIGDLEKEKASLKRDITLHINSQGEIPLLWYIGDNRVTRTLTILNQLYARNSLKQAYSEWINDYKQFVFPDVKYFESLPSVFDAFTTLENLERKMRNVDSDIDNYLEHTPNFHIKNFCRDQEAKVTEPFFVWSSQQYGETIEKFLSGESVTLFSNNTHKTYNAVKLNNVTLSFHLKTDDLESNLGSTLTKLMQSYIVEMTHGGDSYYNCDGNTFVINTSPYTFSVGYSRTSDYKGDGHSKLFGKDFMVSPYATWTFRLIDAREEITGFRNFSDLDKFKGKIDIELVGTAAYFGKKESTNRCKKEVLSQFYESM